MTRADRRVLRLGVAAAAIAAAAWTLALAAPASAHALLRASDPAAGAVLSAAPSQVVITFTEAPDPQLSSIQLLDSTGAVVSKQRAEPVPGDPRQLRLPLPNLPDGPYTVAWRTVSKVDGHVTAGSYAFGIGVSPPATPGGPSGGAQAGNAPIRPVSATGRWALDWGLILLLGAGVAGAFVARTVAQWHRVLLVGAWLLAAAGLVAMALSERSAVDVSLGTLLRSESGQDIVTLAFTLLAPLVMIVVTLVRPRWESLLFLAVATAAPMFVVAISGHAAGQSPEWLNVAVQWIHLLAVGVWIGGLVWLLASMRALGGSDRRAAIRKFSAIAAYALGATIASGIGRAWIELGGWRELFDTAFGITLLIKSAVVAALIVLAAMNRYRFLPRTETEDPEAGAVRRTVRFEVLAAVAIVAVTAILSQLPPGAYVTEAQAKPAVAPSVTVTGSDFGTSVRVRLTVSPGSVGPNAFVAHVNDFDTGKPVPATSVGLRFALPSNPSIAPSTLPLRRTGPGVWSARGANLSIDGTWDLTVEVQESTGAVEVPLKVRTRLPPEQIQVSHVPGQPTLYTIALSTGGTLQTYIDPGRIGLNQVHFTFFKADGTEQPIRSATATAVGPSKREAPLPLTRFDPGHFVANTTLIDGRWTFKVKAVTTDGRPISAYFSQTIGGS